MVNAECPACKAGFQVDGTFAGKKIKCGRCNVVFEVPVVPDTTAPAAPIPEIKSGENEWVAFDERKYVPELVKFGQQVTDALGEIRQRLVTLENVVPAKMRWGLRPSQRICVSVGILTIFVMVIFPPQVNDGYAFILFGPRHGLPNYDYRRVGDNAWLGTQTSPAPVGVFRIDTGRLYLQILGATIFTVLLVWLVPNIPAKSVQAWIKKKRGRPN